MNRHTSMMTLSNGNIFHVTSHLCGEFTGPSPLQRPVTRSFDVFFDLRLNKRLSKQWWGWWFETLSRPLWLHRNAGDTLCASKLLTEERYSKCFFFRSRPPPWVIITQLRWLLMTGWLRVRTLPRIPHHLMVLIIWSCHSNWSRCFFAFCSSFLINCCHFNIHVFKYTLGDIEADLIWTPICRRHFQYHCLA